MKILIHLLYIFFCCNGKWNVFQSVRVSDHHWYIRYEIYWLLEAVHRSIHRHTHTHTSFETAIVLFTCTQSQRSPSYKLTRRCREPQSSGALLTKNSRKKEKTQHKCPPGALLLLCPSFLQGWDIYKAKQTVHCKQLFQPSGPGHRGLVHRETRGVGG